MIEWVRLHPTQSAPAIWRQCIVNGERMGSLLTARGHPGAQDSQRVRGIGLAISSRLRTRQGLNRWLLVTALVLGYGVLVWQIGSRVQASVIESIAAFGRGQLNLFVAHLHGQLRKYEYLPELISRTGRLAALLDGLPSEADTHALNRYLVEIREISDAADVYLMDPKGLTIAASNWDSDQSFVGKNFSFRPYFQTAIRGEPGRYFALGTTSGRRGYYFAFPVRHGLEIQGVLVVKVDLNEVESDWRGLPDEVLVTDPDGIVFISTRPEWRLRSLGALDAGVRARILASRRYSTASLETLPILWTDTMDKGERILEIPGMDVGSNGAAGLRYLMQSQAMPSAGWTVHLLKPLAQVRQQMILVLIVVTAVLLALLFLGLGLLQRYQRLRERARYQERARQSLRQAQVVLERRVGERTADLSEANLRLTQEIEERARAEADLRQTQGELIQAAKLATLGQMSAGINHELNQPLAAVRSYADNARALLDADRRKEVSWNLEQIAELTDRMARIGSQLKIFSRKSTGQISAVSVRGVIETAQTIVAPRLRRTRAEVDVELPPAGLMVRADEVLLQQVLVNLMCNALQAVDGLDLRLVRVHVSDQGATVCIAVEDSGPGVADEHMESIFDPFFTTKDASEGLGLGLTISSRIMEALNGGLIVGRSKLGGARFEILVPTMDQPNALGRRRSNPS